MPLVQLSPVVTGAPQQRTTEPTRRSHVKVSSNLTKSSRENFSSGLQDGRISGAKPQGMVRPLTHSLCAGLMLTTTAVMMATAPPSLARLELPNKEVDDATSPLVQKLLKRTEENRERYQRERLQDYYRRNFKEYFEFEASNAKLARARGLSTESQEAIAKWLQENK